MTCGELRSLAPLYLSGELPADRRDEVAAHLAACPSCKRELESQISLDSQIAATLAVELPDAGRVVQRFHSRVAFERTRRRWLTASALAASLIVGIAAITALSRPAPPPAWFADAARDHRTEVVEKQPRRWRTTAGDIEIVTAAHGLTYAQAAGFAPAGYTLEHAKNCGIDGRRTLHLVFTNGSHEYSIFLSRHDGAGAPLRVVQRNAVQVAGFETGHYRAMVVTAGSPSECETLARLTASRL